MNRSFKSLLIVVTTLLSVNAFAHPGHGTSTGHDIMHYLTSPMHVGIVLTTVVILFVGYKIFKRQTRNSKK
ncbi:MAG: hypothetical protein ABFS32_13595 [Bacteroidota bacterium]